MISVNSISGGKTSCYMAVHYPTDINIFACVCIDYEPAKPKDEAVFKYALDKLNGNFIASAEHEKTLKVVMQLEQVLGKEIVWVRGKSFDQVIDEAGCFPTWARRFCTTEMKIIPLMMYCYFRYGKTLMQIGFRADEPDRIIRGGVNNTLKIPVSCKNYGQRHQNWQEINWTEKTFPLNRTFHYEIRKYWEGKTEFDFPFDSNCRGCHHKPKALIKENWLETPEILEWFALQEKKKKLKGGKYHTFNDDGTMYEDIFKMNFQEKFDFDFTMCNSGGCTD